MPKLKESDLQEFELSEHEQKQAHILSPFTVLHFRNLKAQMYQIKASVEFNPHDMVGYTQAMASLAGKIELIEELLSQHKAVIEELNITE
jgi:hypothetical protein